MTYLLPRFRFHQRFRLFLLLSLSLLITACSSSSPPAQDNLHVSENRIVLNGAITEATLASFVHLLETQPSIAYFDVNSATGDPLAAIQLGYAVYHSGITVRVINECLGPCANYLFTAAAQRIITADAVVAWSGGALNQSRVLQWRNYMLPGVRDFLTRYSDAYLRRESRFFDRINVDQRITTFGFDEHLGCMTDDTLGFYYSPAGLLSLGLGPTQFTEEPAPAGLAEKGFCLVELSDRFLLLQNH
ncbi:MAG: hypothetical protein LAT77_05950 [Aliidiomarina sp.]|uniref:hypothetical protein n=1 Tax=Aliidiomarina sp. TaxID=1872439 RepID=UPI0025BE3C73|nr:hypothetical protein [Aliidiomarina sp.]MCH8501438.1 hypothetical protein [Aliidiomarina sp.]